MGEVGWGWMGLSGVGWGGRTLDGSVKGGGDRWVKERMDGWVGG